uniref:C2H2-type domain-containing protein n=1 Tax=Anopheles atroparvus TaxID=41427 RepID=A0A182IJ73_ANOAO
MTAVRLEHFPNVCLLCLQHPDENLLVSIDEYVQQYSVKLVDFINDLTAPIPSELSHFTPSGVCLSCYEELNAFLAYRKRVSLVVRFVSSLAQVEKGQTSALEHLVSENRADLLAILQELNVLAKDELVVQDILDEFDQYCDGGWTEERSNTAKRDDDVLPQAGAGMVKLESVEYADGLLVEHLQSDAEIEQQFTSSTFEIELQHQEKREPVTFTDRLDHSGASSLHASLDEYCPDEAMDALVVEAYSSQASADNESDETEQIKTPSATRGNRSKFGERKTIGTQNGELEQCKNCKFRTSCITTLQLHMKKHQKKETAPWVCKRCNLRFDAKRELNQHKRSTHRDFMCDTCGMAFDCSFSLQMHRKRHEKVRQYKCEYCPMDYYTRAEKALHVRQAHLKAFEVNCPVCALPFRTKQTLNQHMKTHTDLRTHTCTVCGFSFKSHTHLSRHMKGVHQGVQFTCEHCDTSYRRKDKLRLHMEKIHNIQTYFVCDICLQSYNSAEKLEQHKDHHRNPKDLQCGVCLGAYLTQEEFSEHLCITYRENYICCNRDFKFQSYYNKHMFLIHGEHTNVRVKPTDGLLMGQFRAMRRQEIRCPNCEEEFPTRNQKKNHMRTCGTDPYEEHYIDQPDVDLRTEEQ